jgi:hypothetical protein
MTTILSLTTVEERSRLAYDMINDLSQGDGSNVYLGVGHNQTWSSNDTFVETPIETTDYLNQIYRNLCALKLVQLSAASVVARRVDWANGTFYNMYDENVQMYSYISVENANGTVNVANSTTVTGTNTTFLSDYAPNEIIQLPGDGISLLPQQREIISISNNTVLTVNLAFSGNFVSNSPQELSNTYPLYSKNFYVRNTYDQVFVCLFNNFGAASTVMPALSIGGNLPSDQFLLTSDGYKWKYLYTIPAGLKQSFFTSDWMPVINETQVTLAATDGRLDIIKINNGGRAYNNGAASFSAPIINVIGDGTGANLTAQVDANGTITNINFINPGIDYTVATITVNPGANGVNANLTAVIGPAGGWGSNAGLELGATTVMFSIDLNGTETGTIPTTDALGAFFNYRQLSLIADPVLANNAVVAGGLNYDMTTIINVSANTPFAMNDLIYQSANGAYAGATFTGTVVWFDNTVNNLHINNTTGTFVPQSPMYGTKSANSTPYATVTAFSLQQPLVEQFSGKVLYVENRSAVQRAPAQVENIKLIVGF